MATEITTEQFENVKHVLFGLQKQANVINESVVTIVTRKLLEIYGADAVMSEDAVAKTIESYLIEARDSDSVDDLLVMLIAGEQSLQNIKAIGPTYVDVVQPNPESPKVNFRVCVLGEETLVERNSNVGYKSIDVSPSDTSIREDDDFSTRARKIKDCILPSVPDAVKAEIPDNEYAQALCCAEYYYNHQ